MRASMSVYLVLLGGDLIPTPRLFRQIAGARVIAADSGIRHVDRLGLMPELWIGDFDSVGVEEIDRRRDIPRAVYPSAKDQTDGELAVAEALSRGAQTLILAGAFGGARADHAFLHLALALSMTERGLPVMLTSGTQEGHPLGPEMRSFDYGSGTLFSIIGFGDLHGLTIEGAQWPLKQADVPFGSSLTLSNIVSDRLRIAVRSGRALLVARPDQQGKDGAAGEQAAFFEGR
jgi:thiamine pyrophosphokinase